VAKKKKPKKRAGRGRSGGRTRSLPPIEKLAEYPVHGCWISERWQDPGALVQLAVARERPGGDLVTGVLLVDLGCLGMKNGFPSILERSEFRDMLRGMEQQQRMIGCSIDLAAKVALEGGAYAERLGFQPHPDAIEALAVFAGADPSACDEVVPTGDGNGRPYFISGPNDNVDEILATLDQVVGEGEYGYIIGSELD